MGVRLTLSTEGDFLLLIRTIARSLEKGITFPLHDSRLGNASSSKNHLPFAFWWGMPHTRKNLARHQDASLGPRERNDWLHLSFVSKPSPEPHLPVQFTCYLHPLVFSLQIYTCLSRKIGGRNLPYTHCIPTPGVSVISLNPQHGVGEK